MFTSKKCTHLAQRHLIVAVGAFEKWGIDFVHCSPTSARGHGCIIVAVDYFTKWAEAMPTYSEDDKAATLFLFNHIISHFEIPRAIMTYLGPHFQNKMMAELSIKLGFCHDESTPYYPQDNGQVEAINKVLKTMLQRMVGQAKSNWHLQPFSALWAQHTVNYYILTKNLTVVMSDFRHFPVACTTL